MSDVIDLPKRDWAKALVVGVEKKAGVYGDYTYLRMKLQPDPLREQYVWAILTREFIKQNSPFIKNYMEKKGYQGVVSDLGTYQQFIGDVLEIDIKYLKSREYPEKVYPTAYITEFFKHV